MNRVKGGRSLHPPEWLDGWNFNSSFVFVAVHLCPWNNKSLTKWLLPGKRSQLFEANLFFFLFIEVRAQNAAPQCSALKRHQPIRGDPLFAGRIRARCCPWMECAILLELQITTAIDETLSWRTFCVEILVGKLFGIDHTDSSSPVQLQLERCQYKFLACCCCCACMWQFCSLQKNLVSLHFQFIAAFCCCCDAIPNPSKIGR